MIEITIKEDRHHKEIEAKGHSGYASAGSDIVCAGVSTLVHGWCSLCADYEDILRVQIERMEVEEGYTQMRLYDPDNYTRSAWCMLKSTLKDISEQYPDNVKLSA